MATKTATKTVSRVVANTKPVAGKVMPKGKAKVETKAKAKASERIVLTASGKPVNLETKVTLNPSAKIKVLVENPYRKGSKKAIAFAKFKSGQTVEQAETATSHDRLLWAVRREFVKVG